VKKIFFSPQTDSGPGEERPGCFPSSFSGNETDVPHSLRRDCLGFFFERDGSVCLGKEDASPFSFLPRSDRAFPPLRDFPSFLIRQALRLLGARVSMRSFLFTPKSAAPHFFFQCYALSPLPCSYENGSLPAGSFFFFSPWRGKDRDLAFLGRRADAVSPSIGIDPRVRLDSLDIVSPSLLKEEPFSLFHASS